jgi:hypothetical protein
LSFEAFYLVCPLSITPIEVVLLDTVVIVYYLGEAIAYLRKLS